MCKAKMQNRMAFILIFFEDFLPLKKVPACKMKIFFRITARIVLVKYRKNG